MTLQRLDSGNLSARVRQAILEAILDGTFTDKLPNEDEVGEMLGVSRTTVRSALQSLERDGVVSRQRAKGTTINSHVRPSALALQRLVSFKDLLAEKGHLVHVEADQRRVELPAEIADAFPGELPDDDVVLTDTRFFANGHLAIVIRDALAVSNLKSPGSLPQQGSPSSFDFTRPYCRQPVDHAVVEIQAMVKRDVTCRLQINEGEPFHRLLERHYAKSGELIAVSIIDVDSNYVRFEVVRRQ